MASNSAPAASTTRRVPLRVREYTAQRPLVVGPRTAHVARFTLGPGQVFYVPSRPGLDLPTNATQSPGFIAKNGISPITDNAGVLTNVATISGCTLKIVDVSRQMSQFFAEALASGIGTRHKTVELFAMDPDEAFDEEQLLYTLIIDGYSGTGTTKSITLREANLQTTKEIFPTLSWPLVSSVDENELEMTLAAGDDEDYRFERSEDDPFYPGRTVGYLRVGDDGEIVSWVRRERIGGYWRYILLGRGLFGTSPAAIDVDEEQPIENRQEIREFVYYQEDVRDATLMALAGRTFDDRSTPAHWSAGLDERFIDLVALGGSRFDHSVEVEEPEAQEAKSFVEAYCLRTMQGAVLRVNARGALMLQAIENAPPDAAYVTTFDRSNVDLGTVSPFRVRHDEIANPITALWDYNPATKEFANRTIERDLEAESTHGQSKPLTVEYPSMHTGLHTAVQIRQRLVSLGEAYSDETVTVSFDARRTMRWVQTGQLVRVKLDVRTDDTNGGSAQPLDRTMLVIGRRYDPSTRRVRYFLWGSSGRSIAREESLLASHIPDAEYERQARRWSDTVPVVNGVSRGAGHELFPAKYFHDGDLVLAPDFRATFVRPGVKFQLCVRGALLIQSPNPFAAKAMSRHEGGNGEDPTGPAEPGQSGYFGRGTGGGGWQLVSQYTTNAFGDGVIDRAHEKYRTLGFTAAPTTGIENATGPVSAVPVLDLALNDDQFSGVPADISGSGGAGGAAIRLRDRQLDGLKTTDRKPKPFDRIELVGKRGRRGGLGIEIWSRGGGFSGAGALDTSGEDVPFSEVYRDHLHLYAGAPGPSQPGAVIWIQDDPRAPLVQFDDRRIRANTGDVRLPGERGWSDTRRWLQPPASTPKYHSYFSDDPGVRNLWATAARSQYAPRPAVVERKPRADLRGVGLALSRQRDGLIRMIITETTDPPSFGLPGDMAIAQFVLDGSSKSPYAQVMNDAGVWEVIDWTQPTIAYDTLLYITREYGGTELVSSEERPVDKPDGTLWYQPSTGIERILQSPPAEDIIFRVQSVPLGRQLLTDGRFEETKQGRTKWIQTRNASLQPVNAFDQLAASISSAFIRPGQVQGDFSQAQAPEPDGTTGGGTSGGGSTGTTVLPAVYDEERFATTETTLSLRWKVITELAEEEGVLGYQAIIGGQVYATVQGATATEIVLTGLDPGVLYDILIRPYGANGARGPSRSIRARTTSAGGAGPDASETLDVPRNLRTASVSSTRVELTFNFPADDAGVERYRLSSSPAITGLPLRATRGYFLVEGADPGTDYRFFLRSEGANDTRSADISLAVRTLAAGQSGGGGSGQKGVRLSDRGRRVKGTAFQDNASIPIRRGQQVRIRLSYGALFTTPVSDDRGSFEVTIPATSDRDLGRQATIYANNGTDATRATTTFTYEL